MCGFSSSNNKHIFFNSIFFALTYHFNLEMSFVDKLQQLIN